MMRTLCSVSTIFLCTILLACALPVKLRPSAEQVTISELPPDQEEAERLGRIAVVHGFGCGFGGLRGTSKDARRLLKNRAAEVGANYVQILKITEPYSEPGCLHNEYEIEGTAYREPTVAE